MTEEDIRINQITGEDIKIITKEENLNEEGTDQTIIFDEIKEKELDLNVEKYLKYQQ